MRRTIALAVLAVADGAVLRKELLTECSGGGRCKNPEPPSTQAISGRGDRGLCFFGLRRRSRDECHDDEDRCSRSQESNQNDAMIHRVFEYFRQLPTSSSGRFFA